MPRSARGISLVAALFLIVVLAALGAFAVRIGGGQQQTVNLALLSARALAAADSGIEWGAYRALRANGCATTTTTTLNLTEATLNGFSVTVVCVPTSHPENNGTVHVYRIDATAQAGVYGTPDYVSRHVYATFTDAL
jgi:MSHA biogenesis protein MshP